MNRKKVLMCIFFCCALALTACSRGGDNNSSTAATVTPGGSGAVTPSEQQGTPTNAPATPTVAPTEVPTPTPIPEIGSAEALAINRELRKVLAIPTSGAMGTTPKRGGYGIHGGLNPLEFQYVDPWTGLAADESTTSLSMHISGLKDAAVQERINARIDEVVRAVADPCYVPDVSGILQVMREKGRPEICVSVDYKYNRAGILSLVISSSRKWDDYECWERKGLTFNLVTGDELRLSDIFPEDTDCLALIQQKLEEYYTYEFFFYHENYQSDGEISGYMYDYDAGKEYDAGTILKKITGMENFFVQESAFINGIIFPELFKGEDGMVWLADRDLPTAGEAGDIFLGTENWKVTPLAGIYIDADSEKLGSTLISPEGTDGITVDVFGNLDTFPYFDDSTAKAENVKEACAFLTRERVVELGGLCAEMTLDVDRYCKDNRVSVLLSQISVYPNGYLYTYWNIGDEREAGITHQTLWFRNGEMISKEELFDVSYEELLTEVFRGLRQHGAPAMPEEEAKKAAKVLAPYVVDVTMPETGMTVWFWNEFKFQWGGGRMYDVPGGELPQDVVDGLPKVLLRDWEFYQYDDRLEQSDPAVILRHLKMYAGFSFPEP